MSALTTTEQRTLATCEHAIQSGLETFVEVGDALLKIRDQKLYRATHKTFEAYCLEKWGMSNRRANQMIGASTVVSNIESGNGKNFSQKPATESHVAPLTKLPAEEQAPAWERAQEIAKTNGERVKAKHVEQAVKEINGPRLEIVAGDTSQDPAPLAADFDKRIRQEREECMRVAKEAIKVLRTMPKNFTGRQEAINHVAIWLQKNG